MKFWRSNLLAALLVAVLGATGRAEVFINEGFESFTLKPYTSPTELSAGVSKGDGTDWTDLLPTGWGMTVTAPDGNPTEFRGWRIHDVDSWIATEGDQDRAKWTKGGVKQRGSVMVADGDAFDDGTNIDTGLLSTYLTTPTIDLATVAPGTVVVSFDSFWKNETTQMGIFQVSFDNGTNWTDLKGYDSAALAADVVIDETVSVNVNNPASGKMMFRFGYLNASNDWWWAVDNVKVEGRLVPEPATGSLLGLASMLLVAARRRRG